MKNRAPKWVNVMGAKEGVGCSTVAWQMALHRYQQGDAVLLLEASPGSREPWRTWEDLKKIPRLAKADWVKSFLKGPQGVSCLKASGGGFPGAGLPGGLEESEEIFSLFDWVICDLGSRWSPSACLLARPCRLLFVLNPDLHHLRETRRKLEALALSFFPRRRIGWIAWRWEGNSFLNREGVSEEIGLPCLGESIREAVEKLETLSFTDGDLSAFNPALLFETPAPREMSAPRDAVAPRAPGEEVRPDLKEDILKQVLERMEKEGIQGDAKEVLRPKALQILLHLLDEKNWDLAKVQDRSRFLEELLDELLGLGPLEGLLSDEKLTEILVNGTSAIYVEEEGRLKKTASRFAGRSSLQRVIDRILLPLGRRVDESSPMVDARLPCGSRVHIVLPPLALDGPVISIRRFSTRAISPADWIRLGSADEAMLQFLEGAVAGKKNILVSGGTGSGKTTLLNLLSSFVPPGERIVTIEDAAELRLNQPHVVRLETRPPNIEGKGEVTVRDLVRNALRMRPDRIVVGECRGAEALDMLTAMNTGHEGSLTTLHANSPRDALRRLETLVLFAGIELPLKAVRESIAGAIDLILQTGRVEGGGRKILSVTELEGLEESVYTLRDIFRYEKGIFQKMAI